MREKNIWVSYSTFLRKKWANLTRIRLRIESEISPEWIETNTKIYSDVLEFFITDLRQFKQIALSNCSK